MYLFSYKPQRYVNEPVSYPYYKIQTPVFNVSSLTRNVSTVTAVTTTPHGYSNANIVIVSGASPNDYNGTFQIAVLNDYTFSYTIATTPSTPATGTIFVTLAPQYPITLQQLYDHIRIDAAPEQLSYLNGIIGAVTAFAEDYMNINIIQQSWRTYRDDFQSNVFQLRKSPFVSLQSFQYKSYGIYIDVDPLIYYISKQEYYNQIALTPNRENANWPTDTLEAIDNAIKIEFTAGMATDSTTVPNDLQFALLNHAAFFYENRGNNDIAGFQSSGTGEETSGLNAIPNLTRVIYDNYRVADVFGGSFYNMY
jgi:uncharacterized phiE125 gp8 family phage protein